MPVPVWVIILAVLAGLLLLAVLVLVMYRVSSALFILVLVSLVVLYYLKRYQQLAEIHRFLNDLNL